MGQFKHLDSLISRDGLENLFKNTETKDKRMKLVLQINHVKPHKKSSGAHLNA